MSAALGARHDGYISIVRLSPFNLPDLRRLLIVLKAFADGSNKSHEAGHLTLACIAAPEDVWPGFESAWAAVLQRHGLKWWHTTDAMSLKGRRDFLRDNAASWDMIKARASNRDLEEVVDEALVQHAGSGFQVLTCTVYLDDYQIARERNWFLRTAEAICVNGAIGSLLLDPRDGSGMVYFDRGEKFLKEIHQVWVRDLKKARVDWPNQIKVITHLDAKESYPLQAADLVAWNLSHSLDPGGHTATRLTGFGGRTVIYYDLEEIETRYPLDKERARAEGIRKAGRKTHETRVLEAIEQAERS